MSALINIRIGRSYVLPGLLLCVLGCVLIGATAGSAQTGDRSLPAVYEEDFNDGRAQGWDLRPGWSIARYVLHGKGHSWAKYKEVEWYNTSLSFKFNVWGSGMHANVRVSERGRYAVELGVEDDRLNVRVSKELWNVRPKVFRQLGERLTRYEAGGKPHRGTIEVRGGNIVVSIDDKPVLRVSDPQPLPAGSIAFETFQYGGGAAIDNIVVRADRESPEPPREDSKRVEVPDVRGRPIAEGCELVRVKGLRIGLVGTRPADKPCGIIVDQLPQAGRTVQSGTLVKLVVSSGPKLVEVPRLIELRTKEAAERVKKAGLGVGTARKRTSTAEPGTVVDQHPYPGASVAADTKVDLWIAIPPERATTRVPQLVGEPIKDVGDLLSQADLVLGGVGLQADGRREGTVLGQKPAAGEVVPSRSHVSVLVAKQSQDGGGRPKLVKVPRLIDLQAKAAAERVKKAGLVVGAAHKRTSTAEPGTVVYQNPNPGASVAAETEVDLWIAVPPAPATTRVPRLEGRNIAHVGDLLSRADLVLGGVDLAAVADPEGTVLEQKPDADEEVTVGSPVAIVVAVPPPDNSGGEPPTPGDGNDTLPWPWALGTGILGLGLGYGIRSLKAPPEKREESARGDQHRPRDVRIRVMRDPGRQALESGDDPASGGHIRVRVVADAGVQRLEPQTPLLSQDEEDHER